MNKNIFQELSSGKIMLSDGAWGTMIQDLGLPIGACPEEWNLTHPEKVKQVASAYVDAGSDIILTNTFGGSLFKLSNYNLHDQIYDINRTGVEISKDAARGKALVAASVGPSGKFLAPLGDVNDDEMYESFKLQIIAQADGGADCILIETMTDLGEASIAIKAAKENTSLPVLTTMTFEKGKLGYRTMMGVNIEQAVHTLTDVGADIIGTNCGNGIEQICEIIAEMRTYTDKYLIAHPNAGLPKLQDGKTIFNQTPEAMANYVTNLIHAGAQIIGGCCGTTPRHIKAMAQELKSIHMAR